jgi:hypothetical protein
MNDLEKRELAESAGELLSNKAFEHACAQLEKDWVNELVTTAHTVERKLELIAQIKALKVIPHELKLYVDKYRRRVVG